MSEKEVILDIKNVSKQYRLGQIGGGTLQGDIQSWWARIRGKEDPNTKIGAKQHAKNERFWALDDISLTVNKGEAVGIIGHNGAGKSTLLKLLSRVTAPTKGEIYLNGRIASMLEVGTGFHPEMTGRENIYMNGSILGMTKAEIDSKVEEIIDFSECRQFIDTPVKRYSSGMYVKLAFAVAAHLDSEIMVMDEVLAVGDMKFQQKALGRMGDAAGQEGRTVLYVSHNMNTIRQLCTRCIVLEHGRKIFDGGVEEAIAIYAGELEKKIVSELDLTNAKRYNALGNVRRASAEKIGFIKPDDSKDGVGDELNIFLDWTAEKSIHSVSVRFSFCDERNVVAASSVINDVKNVDGKNHTNFSINTSYLVQGNYKLKMGIFNINEFGTLDEFDAVFTEFVFKKTPNTTIRWAPSKWGDAILPAKISN